MQSPPGGVSLSPFVEEFTLEIEFGPAFDRGLPLAGPPGSADCGVCGQSLPAIEGAFRSAETIPPAVVQLLIREPVERGPRASIRPEAKEDHHARRVADEAEVRFPSDAAERSVGAAVVREHQVDRLPYGRVTHGQAQLGEDEEPPVRRHVLWSVEALASHPEATTILLPENVGGPAATRDRNECLTGLPGMRGLPLNVHEIPKASGRLTGIPQPRAQVRGGHSPETGLGQ